MKKYLITLLLFVFPFASLASDWKYDLSDALSKSENDAGIIQYSVNLEVIDYYIARIA
jgi:hypothetical protein